MALIPGNLLSYNNQSVETSVGDWASFANGASSVVQSGTRALEGSFSVLSTRNATAGDVAMGGITTTGQVPVVSAGQTYVWSFWVWTSISSTVWHAQNDWYQSNNSTFISTVTGPDITVPASTWTEIKSTQTAPALAGVARLFLQCRSGLASTNTANFDQMFFGQPVAAELDRLFLPGSDPVSLDPWAGAPDASHDVIVYAQTASIFFEDPSPRGFLLLSLAGESGASARAITVDDPYAVSPPMLTPDDVTGGMQPWGGAPDSITVSATTANAGVATVSLLAQGPSAGLGSLPAMSSITLAAQAPTAAVGVLPGTAPVTLSAQAPAVGLTALPGAAAVTLAGQQPTVGIAPAAGASSIIFTGRSALAGPGGSAGAASITFVAQSPSVGIAPTAGASSVSFLAQSPTAGVSALPGAAPVIFTGRSATAALGALPSAASVTTSAQQETTGLAVLPDAAPVVLVGLAPSVIVIEGTLDLSVPAFLPDDPYGGILPWAGAQEGLITNDATVNAGVASMVIAAQNASAALGALPGTALMSESAQGPSAGLSALPATSSITLAGKAPLAAVSSLPGTGSVSLTGQGPSVGLAVIPTAAPVSFTAYQISGGGSSSATANAGVASIFVGASGPVAGVGALAGSSSVTMTARSAVIGITALTGAASIQFTATGVATSLPQTGTPVVLSGREPGVLYGREQPGTYRGQDTGLISGGQPLSSTSGNETPPISGREP